MPTFFQRPENALQRAEEFISVAKKQQALDALYDVIKSKKHRTWQKIHEPIMAKYLSLCVDLKKSHIAKEGLYQYKNICQQTNIRSLEDVVRKYLELAEEKTEAARKQSEASVKLVEDIDDLDVILSPENLLLSAVSGEDNQDRADRAILTPWVKFLWESYRQCLDLLRNNNSVEKLYQDIAQQAFRFCLNYTRKTEFRKLCDNLRIHLGHIHKHQNQQRAINLNHPESQAMHLETRLAQLDSAIKMELWQEAFKAIEDIHGLITLVKKHPKASLMANYYQKLGLVFWKSGNELFHACALHRLYFLMREQRKNLTQEEIQKLSSRVVCATLAIPIDASRNQVDQLLEMDEASADKQRRLATLLMLNTSPTRASLIKDLVRFNITQYVHPELQNMFKWLEVDYHPLNLSNRLNECLTFIEEDKDLGVYVPQLQNITVIRLLKQISQIYQTIEFSRFAELAPFSDGFRLEKVIVDAAKRLELQIQIDHRTRSLSFGMDLTTAQREDVSEGPFLQSMPSELIRNQLLLMTDAMEQCCSIITPKVFIKQKEDMKLHIAHLYRQSAKREHENILKRRLIIEERKEQLENINEAKERAEATSARETARIQYEAEMARLEREAKEREQARRHQEEREIKRKAAKEKLEALKATTYGAKVLADMDENVIEDIDMELIMEKQIQHLEKEKKELLEKQRQQEKKVDYFERAKRVEEIPLLVKQAETEAIEAAKFWEEQETARIEEMKTEREEALKHRDRLSRMMDDKDKFIDDLKSERDSIFEEKLKEFEVLLAEEKATRLAERRAKRKEERRVKWLIEKKEEAERKKADELQRKKEEEERLETERKVREAQLAEEQAQKLKEIEEKKRIKEREIEEKEAKRKEELKTQREQESRSLDAPPQHSWKKEAKVGGGGWRDKEKENEQKWIRPSAEPAAPKFSDKFVSRDARLDKDYYSEIERVKAEREEAKRGGFDYGTGFMERGRVVDDRPADIRRGDGWGDDNRRDFGRTEGGRGDFGRDAPRRDFGGRSDDGGRGDFGRDAPRRDFGGDAPRRDFGGDAPRRDFGGRSDIGGGEMRRAPARDEREDFRRPTRQFESDRDRESPVDRRPPPSKFPSSGGGFEEASSWRRGAKLDSASPAPPGSRWRGAGGPSDPVSRDSPARSEGPKRNEDDGWTTVRK